MALSKGKKLILLGIVLVAIDQLTKVLVKTNMCLGDSVSVIGDFLRITFVENEGMAFGMSWGGAVGKIALSTFRIGLFAFLWWWISKLLKRNGDDVKGQDMAESGSVPTGVLVGLTLITAGAFGNIIDCLFYGLIFSESSINVVAAAGGSYAPFMMGKVVDMISFSIFPPVFNFADSCVTCGALYLAIFKWKFFSK